MSRKARRRRAEVLDSTSLAHIEAKRVRYYCPGCGMVRKPESGFSGLSESEMCGNRVIAHYMNTGTEIKDLCPGGVVNPDKDRAP